jgi:hypothetical protein
MRKRYYFDSCLRPVHAAYRHKTPSSFSMKRLCLWSALVVGIAWSVLGCASTDPALRQAISEVKQQPELARLHLRPFAQQGNQAAITQICIAYGRSLDSAVAQAERQEAFAWCAQAAAWGDAQAQYFLGRFHHSGIGTPPSRDLALHWYTQAANQGHAGAEDARRGMQGQAAVCKNPITGCKLF